MKDVEIKHGMMRTANSGVIFAMNRQQILKLASELDEPNESSVMIILQFMLDQIDKFEG